MCCTKTYLEFEHAFTALVICAWGVWELGWHVTRLTERMFCIKLKIYFKSSSHTSSRGEAGALILQEVIHHLKSWVSHTHWVQGNMSTSNTI